MDMTRQRRTGTEFAIPTADPNSSQPPREQSQNCVPADSSYIVRTPFQPIVCGKLLLQSKMIDCVWLASSQRSAGVCATLWLGGSFVRIFSASGFEAWT